MAYETLEDIEILSFNDGSVNVDDIGKPADVTLTPPQTVNEDTAVPLNVFIEIDNPFAELQSITISGVP